MQKVNESTVDFTVSMLACALTSTSYHFHPTSATDVTVVCCVGFGDHTHTSTAAMGSIYMGDLRLPSLHIRSALQDWALRRTLMDLVDRLEATRDPRWPIPADLAGILDRVRETPGPWQLPGVRELLERDLEAKLRKGDRDESSKQS